MSRSTAISYNFGKELEIYLKRKHEETPPWDHTENIGLPLLVQMVHAGELSKEFFILFNAVLKDYIVLTLDKTDDFLWQELKKDLELYFPFVIKYWNINDALIENLRSCAKKAA